MVCDVDGAVGHAIELHDAAAKKRHGRIIPLHHDLRQALISLQKERPSGMYVISSEHTQKMQPLSIVVWFNRAFKALEFKGCSSHSGRRTFITQAASMVHKAGGSLRDVQMVAGHRSIQTTQRYINGDTDAQRKLVAMI